MTPEISIGVSMPVSEFLKLISPIIEGLLSLTWYGRRIGYVGITSDMIIIGSNRALSRVNGESPELQAATYIRDELIEILTGKINLRVGSAIASVGNRGVIVRKEINSVQELYGAMQEIMQGSQN